MADLSRRNFVFLKYGRVAERSTRTTQNRMGVIPCGFESHLAHKIKFSIGARRTPRGRTKLATGQAKSYGGKLIRVRLSSRAPMYGKIMSG